VYGRPGAWTAEQVAAEQAAGEDRIQAFTEVMLLDSQGQRIDGHPLNAHAV